VTHSMSQIDEKFPFGEPVRRVRQSDRGPKRVFVLGVYGSAVHAKWTGADGWVRVQALAVASEPCIFWRGEGVEEIIKLVGIPAHAGHLEPADRDFNGPSGVTLDAKYLAPLGLRRQDAWLCDLVPKSCMNGGQSAAIAREYEPVRAKYGLPAATVGEEPAVLADEKRREEILEEMEESGARELVLLGDKPIKWFHARYDGRFQRLADFGRTADRYGQVLESRIGGKIWQVRALAHPRQAGKLGKSNAAWFELHRRWVAAQNPAR
jgi:hypothetical protein